MELNQIHKLTWRYIVWKFLQVTLLAMISFFLNEHFFNVVIFVGIIYIIYSLITRYFITFSLDEKQINTKMGILFRSSKTVRYNKLQDLELTAGPLMRMVGLVKVNFWTASPNQVSVDNGSSSSRPDTYMYLVKVNAEWVERFINAKVEK